MKVLENDSRTRVSKQLTDSMLKKNDLIVNRIVKKIVLTTRSFNSKSLLKKFDKAGKNWECSYFMPGDFIFSSEIIKQFERMFKRNDFKYTIRVKHLPDGRLLVKALINLPEVFRTGSLKRMALLFNEKLYIGIFRCTKSQKKSLKDLLEDKSFSFTFTNKSITVSTK